MTRTLRLQLLLQLRSPCHKIHLPPEPENCPRELHSKVNLALGQVWPTAPSNGKRIQGMCLFLAVSPIIGRPLTESEDGTWTSSGTRIQGSLPQKRDPFPGQIILRSTPCRDQATDLTLENAPIMQGVVQMELLLPQG